MSEIGTRTKLIKIIYDQRLELAARRRQRFLLRAVVVAAFTAGLLFGAHRLIQSSFNAAQGLKPQAEQWLEKQTMQPPKPPAIKMVVEKKIAKPTALKPVKKIAPKSQKAQ